MPHASAFAVFAGGPFHGLAFDGGTFDLGFPTEAGITIGGLPVHDRVRVAGLTIRDVLNDAPNTCSFTMQGAGPVVGQTIRIAINADALVLFAGTIQTVDQAFESLPEHVAWHVTAIDDTAKANARRPFGTWVATSATTIAQSLRTTYAPSFSGAGIEAGLPAVSIVFDGSDTLIAALVRLATAIGGYAKIDDGVIYLFLEDPTAPPDPIDDTHRFLMTPAVQANVDSSQLRTRVYGKGYGENILADVAIGETLVPIPDGAQFPPGGSQGILATTPDGAQSEKIAFTGVVLSVGGTLVGPGAAPTTAPGLVLTSGTGIESGTHDYAQVFVTATGKSLAGARASMLVGPVASNPSVMTAGFDYEGYGTGLPAGYRNYAYTFKRVSDGAETALSPIQYGSSAASGAFNRFMTNGGGGQPVMPAPPAGCVRQWYRTLTGTAVVTLPTVPSAFKRIPVGGIFSNGTDSYQSGVEQLTGVDASFWDGSTDASLGATAPSAAAGNRVIVTWPAGPSTVTNIEIYRTAIGSAQLKLVYTVGSNTAGATTDSTPDASLGANAPVGDTSGLKQPEGQVNPGAAVLPVASPTPFRAGGGWVVLSGGQVVRYSAISGNTLTGIPATGAGAILVTVLYGQQARPAAMLTGVTGILVPILKGSAVAIWVQRDDLPAQAEHAARTGGDGIVEYLIVDQRRAIDSLTARCDADLALFSRPIVTVAYATRDLKTKSGKPITIDLDSPAIHETLTIQEVTITEIDLAPGLAPRFSVRASTVRFSLEDTLRRLMAIGPVVGGSS